MQLHHLKIMSKYFRAVRQGSKTYEFRKNDRKFMMGDLLDLWEIDDETGRTTGHAELVRVLRVDDLSDVPGFPEGYCIMPVERVRVVPNDN